MLPLVDPRTIRGDTLVIRSLSRLKVFVTQKAQPASNPRRIISPVVAAVADARPNGFLNFRPSISMLMSTSSMGLWNSGSRISAGTAPPADSCRRLCMCQLAVFPSLAASTVIVAPTRSPPANSQGTPTHCPEAGSACTRPWAVNVAGAQASTRALSPTWEPNALITNWHLMRRTWSSSGAHRPSAPFSILRNSTRKMRPSRKTTSRGVQYGSTSTPSFLGISNSSGHARISLNDRRKHRITRSAPHRKALLAQSMAVSPAPSTMTVPCSAGRAGVAAPLQHIPGLEALDTCGRKSLLV
mmetsp:Transcript_828/g.1476  ORF Transcript_828/g.1476 Transcript_828/m.1476 type:complete len:299 (-) Transcript_828:255-1151(-)